MSAPRKRAARPPAPAPELDTELPIAAELEAPDEPDAELITAAMAAAQARSAGAVATVAIAITDTGEIVGIDNVPNAQAGRPRADELVAIAGGSARPMVVTVQPGTVRAQTWTDGGELRAVDRPAA